MLERNQVTSHLTPKYEILSTKHECLNIWLHQRVSKSLLLTSRHCTTVEPIHAMHGYSVEKNGKQMGVLNHASAKNYLRLYLSIVYLFKFHISIYSSSQSDI